METSLVGGIQQLKAKRKRSKIKARTRVAMAKNARKRKLAGAQRAPSAGLVAPMADPSDLVAPHPPPVAEPFIRVHRRKEKHPTIEEILPDGSYI